MNYKYADIAIKDMNRRNLVAFNRLKQLKFDELNVLKAIADVYEKAVRRAKRRYLSVARWSYIEALIALGVLEEDAKKRANEEITEDYIVEMLDEYDPVTLYLFTPEIDRKKQRCVEALMSTPKKNESLDRSLKLLTLQLAHYADKAVIQSTLSAYREMGIKKVRWVTQGDEKVCEICEDLDGNVYRIDKVPPPQHYRCRCELEPVK